VDESPAQLARIVAGDIMLRLDGAAIYSVEDLASEIHNRKIGDKVKLTILRRGREQSVEATLSKIP
jgi:S1-C subfamily serine protease